MITTASQHRRAAVLDRVAAFNQAHPVGTLVKHWQHVQPFVVVATTSAAFWHRNTAAVHVVNASQPILLSNLEVVSAEALALLTHDDAVDHANQRLAIAAREPYLSPAAGDECSTHSPRPAVRDVHELQLPPGDRS